VVDRVGIEPFKKDVYMDPLLAKTSNLVRESNV
jgi:sulfite reductase (NADPH) hemoprotein beta-component